jgi:hypothetical protein
MVGPRSSNRPPSRFYGSLSDSDVLHPVGFRAAFEPRLGVVWQWLVKWKRLFKSVAVAAVAFSGVIRVIAGATASRAGVAVHFLFYMIFNV